MKIDEAKETRDKYLKIIGMTSPLDMEIIGVIIEPLGIDIGEKFRSIYISLIRGGETFNNDKMLFLK